MSQHIDMSLDDIIKQNKTQRIQERSFKRPKPAQNKNHQRSRPFDKPQRSKPAPQTASKTGLFITNLHFDVTNAQLRERCGAVGRLQRLGINWDQLGRSKGTAEVDYVNPEDAKKAITELDGLELEGRKIGVRAQGPEWEESELTIELPKPEIPVLSRGSPVQLFMLPLPDDLSDKTGPDSSEIDIT